MESAASPGPRRGHARRGACLAAAFGAAAVLVPSAGGTASGSEVVVRDGKDAPGALDLAAARFGARPGGRLRGEWTTRRPWTAKDLAHPGGPPGSFCFRLWIHRVPGTEPPDYLVCAVPRAGGRLSASVLRDRPDGGPPRRVASAGLRRLGQRGLAVSFAAKAVGAPSRLRVAAETTTWKGCPRPVGCLDTSPDAPRTLRLVLR